MSIHKSSSFDFYLPEYNVVIEYHGKQHYELIELFRGEEGFVTTQLHDKIIKDYCISNGIEYIEIPCWEEDIENTLLEHLVEAQS